MKKIKIITLILIMLLLVGCNRYDENSSRRAGKQYAGGYFTVIRAWGGIGERQYMLVYANDTKVVYYVDSLQNKGLTPLYNADGTIQVYQGE